MRARGDEPAFEGWPPAADSLWLVHGTMGAVVYAQEATGERVAVVAMRIGSRLNGVGTEGDRTYVLGLEQMADLLSGLMSAGNQAFGNGAMMTAMAEALHIDPRERDRTTEAVDRAVRGLRDE